MRSQQCCRSGENPIVDTTNHRRWFRCGRPIRCRKPIRIILLAFAPLGHAIEPRLLDDPLIVSLAQRFGKTPAQVLLAWGIQRGTAVLTSTVRPARISENFDVTALPESAIEEINELETRYRFSSVVETGIPGFIEVPRVG